MNLNLDNRNVFERSLTVEEIRNDANGDALAEMVLTWLDEVQGEVFTRESEKAYLVIEVTK